jgi:hypothetical protein
LPQFEFESKKLQWFYLYLSCVENHLCLSHGVHVTDAIWQAVMSIVAGVGDLVQRTGMVKHMSGTQSPDRETLCAVCTVTLCAVYTEHKETRSAGFLVWSEKQGQWFLPVCPQNQWLRVSWFGPQN